MDTLATVTNITETSWTVLGQLGHFRLVLIPYTGILSRKSLIGNKVVTTVHHDSRLTVKIRFNVRLNLVCTVVDSMARELSKDCCMTYFGFM